MGIRGLTKHLLPYADWRSLGNPSQHQSEGPYHPSRNVVIDGPSFAFFVYRRLLNHSLDRANIIHSIPNYNTLGHVAVAFLLQLQDCGLLIDRICFDGFLPEHKIETRQQRLEKIITELFNFRASHPDGFSFVPSTMSTPAVNEFNQEDATLALQDLFGANSATPTFLNLPNPPFIVPAVIHALRASEFKCMVEMVPGEADPYCAVRACEIHGLIFTTDSDLLIHDSGPGGSVVMLDHIQLQPSAESGVTIRAPVFEPWNISKKLGIGDDAQALQSLAYFLQEVPGTSFHQALRKVRSHREQGAQLARETMSLLSASSQILRRHEAVQFDNASLRYFRLHGQHLDPRLAELCLQFHLRVSPAQHAIYLPVLLQDPARASAWEISVPLRQFAYTCFAQGSSCGSMPLYIHEYRRKGRRLVGITLYISNSKENNTFGEATIICDQLEPILKAFANICPVSLRWRYLAARYVLHWYDSESKTPPSFETVKHMVTGNCERGWSWDDIHFAAQMEGVLYSIHMIRQAFQYLQYIPLERGPTCNVDRFATSTVRMVHIIKDLPSFEKLLISMKEIERTTDLSELAMLDGEIRRCSIPIS